MLHRCWVGAVLLVLWGFSGVEARPWRTGQIPNGNSFSCGTCHVDPNGGGARNAFGQAVGERVSVGGEESFWNAALAALDSDGDGATNGQELGDPDGDGNPTAGATVTNPGDRNSKPQVTNTAPVFGAVGAQTVEEGQALSFTVQATDKENNQLTYTADGLPSGATFQNRTFSWTPGAGQGGQDYTVTFTVSDGTAQATMNVRITVEEPMLQPLEIQSFSPDRTLVVGAPGTTLDFSVTATGPGPVTYAWTVNGVAQADTGATLSHVVAESATDDTVAVSVSSGSESLTQTWSVAKTLRGDFTADGQVNLADFIAFARVFNKREGDPEYDAKFDLNGSTVIDFGDFIQFAKFFGLP